MGIASWSLYLTFFEPCDGRTVGEAFAKLLLGPVFHEVGVSLSATDLQKSGRHRSLPGRLPALEPHADSIPGEVWPDDTNLSVWGGAGGARSLSQDEVLRAWEVWEADFSDWD